MQCERHFKRAQDSTETHHSNSLFHKFFLQSIFVPQFHRLGKTHRFQLVLQEMFDLEKVFCRPPLVGFEFFVERLQQRLHDVADDVKSLIESFLRH